MARTTYSSATYSRCGCRAMLIRSFTSTGPTAALVRTCKEGAAMGRGFEDKIFLALVAGATLAFLWLIWTFFAAILWAVVAAIIFAPMQKRLISLRPEWPSSMAALTLLTLVAIVILPLIV